MNTERDTKTLWEVSFKEALERQANNSAPVEAIVRNTSYYLRSRPKECSDNLHFLDLGCGTGPNMLWLAGQGVKASGIDIAPTALQVTRQRFAAMGMEHRLGACVEGSVTNVPLDDETFDGAIEACVFQHLDRTERTRAFDEVYRLLKPGGLFVGYMLSSAHTVYRKLRHQQLRDDPGTLDLCGGGSNIYLTNLGLAHFFSRRELLTALQSFSLADVSPLAYYLPHDEAKRRGYPVYRQAMWSVYAVK